jgi:hypothetical protein
LPFDYALIITVVAGTVVAACLIVLYAMSGRGKKKAKVSEEQKSQASLSGLPFKVAKSVSSNDAGHAKDELRILDLEREILSDAIRKLYEASAEGKISEEERERLGQTYKSRMMTVKDAISRDESVVALHELEAMQEDLIKLFSERFDELSGKIDELRQRTEAKPIKEISIPTSKSQQEESAEEKTTGEEKAKRKRKPPSAKPSPRTEAEKRIEEIRNEVEKVLDRLGQMEIEG